MKTAIPTKCCCFKWHSNIDKFMMNQSMALNSKYNRKKKKNSNQKMFDSLFRCHQFCDKIFFRKIYIFVRTKQARTIFFVFVFHALEQTSNELAIIKTEIVQTKYFSQTINHIIIITHEHLNTHTSKMEIVDE